MTGDIPPGGAPRLRIAVFAGPTATILNTPDLVTSNKARARHGLPLRPARFDVLRPQRLAAPATLYVEAYSAHPLEDDAAGLYAPPDGWLDKDGAFHAERPHDGAIPVHVVELDPADGLYPLPYMGRQADGSAWEETSTAPYAPPGAARQTFYPDARRLYEEIERFGLGDLGAPVELGSVADFAFFRAAPSGGYTTGPDSERLGQDFFVYYPYHLQSEPGLADLARATNQVQDVLASGEYAGVQWLEGSPTVDETLYWLGLLIDTTAPLVGHAAQRRHQSLSADGDRNVVDGVKFIASGVALDERGEDRVGACVIVDELVYSARDVTKVDARPGGYEVTGGHGGVVADLGGYGPPQLTYLPARRHTHRSELRLTLLPERVPGVTGSLAGGVSPVDIATKDAAGLVPAAMPHVSITKYSRYAATGTGTDSPPVAEEEVEVLARIDANLADAPLAGFVCEGMSPFGMADPTRNAALSVAVFAGLPVVRTGRGNTGGMAYRTDPVFISGNNLTATKARLLLMAALLKFGALPPAADPFAPTLDERAATEKAVARYQTLFDTH
ncbi:MULTISPECIES: asparaginase domain-containing protein [Streptomyces]|uniref:asparaginase domain-containing protein n=1 Tax=Streptomyces TaxID=1883 RepID=UPI0020351BD9|nr:MULTISPECIES: asparaginase domain-containing protein [Streptomyces]UUA05071.1 asparaginase domain-containing protein [Streptomyces koelreuteriae]UUA12695.1 asparaginase domain-containing protein [Streptomyces sp. CRCS-T-1]